MATQTSTFLAILSRLKYIERWALMRNSRPENLSEHSLEVAMIAHMLCTIANVRYGRTLDANEAAVQALYHDASEIITGDMPTPVKYFNPTIKTAYKDVEAQANKALLNTLPEDLQPAFEAAFFEAEDGEKSEAATYQARLVKAADKLSALIKCIEEEAAGNTEFETAKQTTQETLATLAQELPEVADFMLEFLPSYGRTLDELL